MEKDMSKMDRWDLTILYNGFDDPKYKEDVAALEAAVIEYKTFAEGIEKLSDADAARGYIRHNEKICELIGDVMAYADLLYAQNTKDSMASSALGRVLDIASGTAASDALCKKRLLLIEDPIALAEKSGLSEFGYLLTTVKRDAKHMLSDKEEELFAKMNISGAAAWSDLQSSLTSGVKVKYGDSEIPLSAARNLANNPDPKVRKDAYHAELACYEGIKDAVAFALNNIKLQVINECKLRGYASPLDKALSDSRMKRETLDALIGAMEEYMPVFRKYLKAKAKALGHEGALPWYDMFSPIGKSEKVYTAKEARDYLVGIFSEVDSDICNTVKDAFDGEWIDFFPREGKVGGAFDYGISSKKVSRILTNFDGSFSDVVTLAHELGHSFHDRQIFSNSVLNQSYSMPVAETASTFNEVLVMESAIDSATDRDEKLALLERQLMDTTQIICDIYSRFKFESAVFAERENEFLSADRLSELMLGAQELAYGDGLDKDVRHPYMWLCKGHYYSGSLSFYNFPYAFGGLFARGLYARYKQDGAKFMQTYKKMLTFTGMADVEEAAMIAGVDVTSKEFWREGLETIAKKIDQFCDIVK